MTVGERHGHGALLGTGLEPAELLLASMPDTALVVDRDARILYANHEEPGRQATGTTLFDQDLGADAEARIRAALHQVFERGKPMSYEVESRERDSDEISWYLSRWSPVERGGEVVAALVVSSDITRRVTLERDLQRISHVGSWEWDPATGAVTWSSELYGIFGVDPKSFEPSYESILALVHPDDRALVEEAGRRAVETCEPFSIDQRIVRPDGGERVLLSNARVETGLDGRPIRLTGICLDITDRKDAELQLEHVSRQREVILASAAEGIVGLDSDGCLTFANPAAAELLGWTPEAVRGRDVHEVVHGACPEGQAHGAAECPLLAAVVAGEVRHVEDDVFCRRDGASRPVTYTSAPIVERGTLTGAVLTFNDVTERKRFEAQLQYLADHDASTGLYNRRRFEEELRRHATRHEGGGGAVLAIDIDNFKYVNDTLGHKAGDEVITHVARNIADRLRDADTLARFGGDEFAALLPGAGIEHAQATARTIIDAVRAQAVTVAGQQIRVTASVGITSFGSREGVTGEQLLLEADLAMYEAKGAGRDRFALYTPMAVREAQIESRLEWVGRVRAALDEGRFTLYAQPVVSVATGDTVQYELLVRMVDEDDLILPGAFAPAAERFGLMPAVDRWVAREAIRLLAEGGPSLRLEINVSGESMADDELTHALDADLKAAGVDPGRLVVEATERTAFSNLEAARRFAQDVRHIGCEFALDDFGAGFGSFYYLKYLPFDYLKIDGDYIHSLPANRTDQLVVRALADVARGLGRRTIAEYVGDDDTLALLRDCGVDMAQGHYLGRPVPATQLIAVS